MNHARSGLITVVIPTRDRRVILERTLRTVLWQREVAIEVVIVDEGSSDETPEFLASLSDPRVRSLRHDPPRGVAGARNAGLASARGRWVAFTDDDDLWAPLKLRRQLDAIDMTPGARWSTVGCVVVDESLEVVAQLLPPVRAGIHDLMLRANVVPGGGSGVLVETALAREVGGFDTELSNLADWEMWLRLAERSPVAAVPLPLLAYLRHATSLSHAIGGTEREVEYVLSKHAAAYAADPGSREEARAWAYGWIGDMYARGGAALQATRRIAQAAAVERAPGRLRRIPVALAGPRRFGRCREVLHRRRIDDAWASKSDEWLDLVRGRSSVPD